MQAPRCTAEEANLAEIYSAIQGEGTRVGERQVFVRFLECPIHCNYCDTPDQDPAKVRPRVERTAGKRDWEERDNPFRRAEILAAILRLQAYPGLHRWVSFTGGEPLWYWPMIQALAPDLRRAGLAVYLETNGLMHEELAQVLDAVDLVAMDVKLHPKTHGFWDREATLRFLRLARQKELFIKIVIPPHLKQEAFLPVVEALRPEAGEAVLVLQPVTPYGAVKEAPRPEEMLELQAAVNRIYPDSRVVPQVHKLIGQL